MLALLPWGRIALVAGILAAGFGGGWQLNGLRLGAKMAALTAEISRLQTRSTILEPANAQCEKSVKAANEATDRLLAEGQRRSKMAAEALRTAQAESAALGTSIATLRSQAAPTDLSCPIQAEASRKLIADEVRGRK